MATIPEQIIERIREQTTGHSGKLEAAVKEEAAQAKKDKAAKSAKA